MSIANSKKSIAVITTIILLFILIIPVKSQAASARLKTLKPDKTYKSLDVTGDGRKDTFRIRAGASIDHYSRGLQILVNGKTAYRFSSHGIGFFKVNAKLITLSNGKRFLFVNCLADSAVEPLCAVFKYKNGKFKKIIDINENVNKYGYNTGGMLKRVKGNTILFDVHMYSYSLGLSYYQMSFSYRNGILKQKESEAKLKYASTYENDKTKQFIVNKTINVYSSPNGGNVKFRLYQGDEIVVDKCRISPSKMSFRIKCDGETGWVKALRKYPYPEYKQQFSNILFGS